MQLYVITDLEGVAGIDRTDQCWTDDEAQKAEAMDQLGRETNALVEGVRSVEPDADVDVWDGHGSGGLREADLEDATFMSEVEHYPVPHHDYDAVAFVGQHAMAGMPFAPLRHTQSSSIEYYRLNGTFIGEFGGGAVAAGLAGIPTVVLAGDDKACHEAELFAPEIETAAVKYGTGFESATHLDPGAACDRIREAAARATERVGEIPPVTGFEPPFTVDLRFEEPRREDRTPDRWQTEGTTVEWLDDRTVRRESDTFTDVYP